MPGQQITLEQFQAALPSIAHSYGVVDPDSHLFDVEGRWWATKISTHVPCYLDAEPDLITVAMLFRMPQGNFGIQLKLHRDDHDRYSTLLNRMFKAAADYCDEQRRRA